VKAVDSSVVIAAFASWHEHHAITRKAMTGTWGFAGNHQGLGGVRLF
jgi:hypothetical protein